MDFFLHWAGYLFQLSKVMCKLYGLNGGVTFPTGFDWGFPVDIVQIVIRRGRIAPIKNCLAGLPRLIN